MRSWIVSNNFTKKSFTKFKEAVEFFKSLIKSHIEVNEYFYDECGYPTVENKYFYDKLSNALISDNEIVISQRSEMLMSSLLWEEVNKSSEYIRESIKKDYHYSGEGENGGIRAADRPPGTGGRSHSIPEARPQAANAAHPAVRRSAPSGGRTARSGQQRKGRAEISGRKGNGAGL